MFQAADLIRLLPHALKFCRLCAHGDIAECYTIFIWARITLVTSKTAALIIFLY